MIVSSASEGGLISSRETPDGYHVVTSVLSNG